MRKIIVLSGPDGVGKSTIIKILKTYLIKRGEDVRTCWMRGSHTFAWILGKFLSKFPSMKGTDNPYFNIRIPKNIKKIWQIIETLSGLPYIIVNYVLRPNF